VNPAVKPAVEADDRVQAVVSQQKTKVTDTILRSLYWLSAFL